MRRVPLNIQTLYADLLQQVQWADRDVEPGTVSPRTISGITYLYAVERHGPNLRQRYLGPQADPDVRAAADAIARAQELVKIRRKTVAALKRAGLPSPPAVTARVLEALAQAGLFGPRALVLVGTAAFATYAPLVGVLMRTSSTVTHDIDLGVSLGIGRSARGPGSVLETLQRGDPTLQPDGAADPPHRFRGAGGLVIEFLTKLRRGGETLVDVPGLKVKAEALPFFDFLLTNPISVVALQGAGILVTVPEPARYAVHKLLIAQRRHPEDPKRLKDLTQAGELIEALERADPYRFEDILDEARERGRTWRRLIDLSLAEIGSFAR